MTNSLSPVTDCLNLNQNLILLLLTQNMPIKRQDQIKTQILKETLLDNVMVLW